MKNIQANKLLGQSSFWIVNKHLARYFGDNDMALLIADMLDKQQYFTDLNQLVDNYWWYNTQRAVKKDCNIPRERHSKYMNTLEELEIIERCKMGVPCRTFYHIDERKVLSLLCQK